MIDFSTIAGLREAGFAGFASVQALCEARCKSIPEQQGVYLTVAQSGLVPKFLEKSPAGHFKGKDPTVPVSELKENWVPGAIVLYIGKAGGQKSKVTLKARIKQYLAFGRGIRAAHRGGRYVWQIEGAQRLMICWKPTPEKDSREVERVLIGAFKQVYGKLPFANLQD